MAKRRLIALGALILAAGFVLVLALGNQSDLGAEVVACDAISFNGRQLLFTIEGVNDTVYSEQLASYLKTGTTIKVYQNKGAVVQFDSRPIEPAQLKNLKLKCIYQNEMASAHPWLISVGQADDDAHIEVFVGAFRATQYLPAETRPYFLEYRDGVLVRSWTGSRLMGLAFSAARYIDVDGDGYDELEIVEHGIKNGKRYSEVGYYRLYGFIPYRLNEMGGRDE